MNLHKKDATYHGDAGCTYLCTGKFCLRKKTNLNLNYRSRLYQFLLQFG